MEMFGIIFVSGMLTIISIAITGIGNSLARIANFLDNNKQEVFAYLRNTSMISEHTHEIKRFIEEDRNEAKEYKSRINNGLRA